MTDRRSRRAFLGLSAALASAAAGCSGGSDPVPDETITPAPVPTVETTTEDGLVDLAPGDFDGPTVTVAHSLSGQDRLAGFRSMADAFRKRHGIDVRRPGGTSLSLTRHGMRKRIDRGYPPGVWQINAGEGTAALVADDLLVDLEQRVWEAGGLKDTYPPGVEAIAGPGEHYVAVPWNGERLNNLFYNREVVEQGGIDPTALSGVEDLHQALSVIQRETDATPFALPTDRPWGTGYLLENILLSQAGPAPYQNLAYGKVTDRERQSLRRALSTIAGLRPYFPTDASDIDWTDAVRRVADGEAAMTVCGDRAVGGPAVQTGFDNQTGPDGGKHWAHTTVPGTEGFFHFDAPAFVAPGNNPTPKRTATWLRFCGSREGQRAFAREAGTIPLRPDTEVGNLPPYQQGQFRDYRSADVHVPSMTAGLTLNNNTYAEVLTALFRFTSGWNVEQATERITAALAE